ncbi:MAG: SPOR domain-containing protein [Crocinitomicaceae bacterium]
MNKYLIEILKLQSSVILPGFGSLMITNSKTGKVSFNPHLKFNDGSLATFIAEKEKIDQQEAQNKIAKFVREIEADLGKGDKYSVLGLGEFSKDKDGNVEFKTEGEGIGSIEEAAKTPAKKEEAPAKKEEAAAKKEEAPSKKEEAASKKATKKSEKEEKKKSKASVAAAKAEEQKNQFKPTDKKEAGTADSKKPAAKEEKAKPEIKKPEVKPIPKKEDDSKKEGNKFTPSSEKEKKAESTDPTDKKDADPSSSKSAAEKESIIESMKVTAVTSEKDKAMTEKPDNSPKEENKQEDKSIQGLKDKYKKSSASSSQKPSAKEKKPKAEKGDKKKKSKWPLIIILIIILGGGATAGYIFKDDIMALINGKETTDEEAEGSEETVVGLNEIPDSLQEAHDAESLVDTMNTALEDNTDVAISEETQEEVVSSSPGGNYHVIGNAFKDKSNAQGYVSAMKNKGYSSAKIVGQFDGLHMVSVQQFDSRSPAQSACSKVGGGAWVFKYPK